MSWAYLYRLRRLRPKKLSPTGKLFLSGLRLEKVDWEKNTEEGQAAIPLCIERSTCKRI